MNYAGKAVETSSADLVAGKTDGPLVDVAFHVEAKMAVPPWFRAPFSVTRATGSRTPLREH